MGLILLTVGAQLLLGGLALAFQARAARRLLREQRQLIQRRTVVVPWQPPRIYNPDGLAVKHGQGARV